MNAEDVKKIFDSLKLEECILKYFSLTGAKPAFFVPPWYPEEVDSPVLMASLYRVLGYAKSGLKNADYTFFGTKLKSAVVNGIVNLAPFDFQQTRQLLEKTVVAPHAEASGKYAKHLFLYPLTPAAVLFSHPVRLVANPAYTPINGKSGGTAWEVGKTLLHIFRYASVFSDESEPLPKVLFDALSVKDSEEEDAFAIVFEKMLREYIDSGEMLKVYSKNGEYTEFQRNLSWVYSDLSDEKEIIPRLSDDEIRMLGKGTPISVMDRDLRNIVRLKSRLTRCQWISILEAYLRLSLPAFFAWQINMVCRLHAFISDVILSDRPLHDVGSFVAHFSFANDEKSSSFGTLQYGKRSAAELRKLLREYGRSTYWLSLFDRSAQAVFGISFKWTSFASIFSSLEELKERLSQSEEVSNMFRSAFAKKYEELLKESDVEASLRPKSPRFKHFLELFSVLNQNILDKSNGYSLDQSYWIRKKNQMVTSSPYIIEPGALSLLTLTQCCIMGSKVSVTLAAFCEYLLNFGVVIPSAQLSAFTTQLRGLGITMDSPDAEEGVLIIPPFSL